MLVIINHSAFQTWISDSLSNAAIHVTLLCRDDAAGNVALAKRSDIADPPAFPFRSVSGRGGRAAIVFRLNSYLVLATPCIPLSVPI